MVYIVTSQIQQTTERFFHQSGLFEYFQNTTSGINKFHTQIEKSITSHFVPKLP